MTYPPDFTNHAGMIAFVSALNQGAACVDDLPEAASQSATKAGDLVYLSGGGVTVCGDEPTTVWGIMLQDCTGTTSNSVKVLRIRPGDEFEATVVSGTTVTAANRGIAYVLEKTAAGYWQVNTETDADLINILGPGKTGWTGAASDGYSQTVRFTFLPATLQAYVGS